MPRANRYLTAGAAYHLTHRCHDRAFLLKFARDRDGYREILRVESARRGLSVLSYAITSNHVHLLVADTDAASVAAFMQATQGRFAEEYNRRKGRQGAFWSDRYHATMTREQHSAHLMRAALAGGGRPDLVLKYFVEQMGNDESETIRRALRRVSRSRR